MKRWILGFVGVLLALLLAFVALVFWHMTASPKGPRLPLPEGQVALGTKQGQRWLKESRWKGDLARLQPVLATQSRRAYCGVASSVTVLNALKPPKPFRQAAFFNPKASRVISKFWVSLRGISLDELSRLLRSQGVKVQKIHAKDTTAAEFRKVLKGVLNDPLSYAIANYSREVLKQKGFGHISPIGAYHEKADRVLVMDVATYKYPPHWLPLKALWRAMQTEDPSVKKSRGFAVVRGR